MTQNEIVPSIGLQALHENAPTGLAYFINSAITRVHHMKWKRVAAALTISAFSQAGPALAQDLDAIIRDMLANGAFTSVPTDFSPPNLDIFLDTLNKVQQSAPDVGGSPFSTFGADWHESYIDAASDLARDNYTPFDPDPDLSTPELADVITDAANSVDDGAAEAGPGDNAQRAVQDPLGQDPIPAGLSHTNRAQLVDDLVPSAEGGGTGGGYTSSDY